MRSDGLPAEFLKVGLVKKPLGILSHFHSIIIAVYMSRDEPEEWKDATIGLLQKKED